MDRTLHVRRTLALPAMLALVLAAVGAGCGASARSSGDDVADGGGTGGGDGGGGAGDDGGGFGPTDSDGGGGGTGATLLYAHTDTTLYALDATNVGAPPQKLGRFDCVGGSGEPPAMTDLGVAKDGKLYGVSQSAAFPLTVQPGGVVHCETKWPLPTSAQFYGLTVAPENTVAATEVLIAANDAGQLFQLDATSGQPTQVGTLGTDPKSGKPWSLSGDIVFLANGGSPLGFATVRTCSADGSNCSTTDTLVEVDVTAVHAGTQSVLKSVRGPVVKGSWCTNASSPSTFGSMFGVAAFGDKVYGFSRRGDVVEIRNDDGTGCLVQALSSDAWAGAGVATTAKVVAPPPK